MSELSEIKHQINEIKILLDRFEEFYPHDLNRVKEAVFICNKKTEALYNRVWLLSLKPKPRSF